MIQITLQSRAPRTGGATVIARGRKFSENIGGIEIEVKNTTNENLYLKQRV
jgi:hypothetical protein